MARAVAADAGEADVATPVIEINGLTKVYHLGEVDVRALDGVLPHPDPRVLIA